VLDVVLGTIEARGRLPFELPSSMQAVERQYPALPDDSQAPLIRSGIAGRLVLLGVETNVPASRIGQGAIIPYSRIHSRPVH